MPIAKLLAFGCVSVRYWMVHTFTFDLYVLSSAAALVEPCPIPRQTVLFWSFDHSAVTWTREKPA